MGRVQLALRVEDLDAAVDFYERLFGTTVAKRRPGYANFAVADPPLKLVLFQGEGPGTALDHLGVEVGSVEEVAAAQARLQEVGLVPEPESGECCYALQEKVWVNGPSGARWEVYTVLADVPTTGTCCGV
jgi:catechol 2,3-dioxygenase-like lactoylglutathione lyase family enzyme